MFSYAEKVLGFGLSRHESNLLWANDTDDMWFQPITHDGCKDVMCDSEKDNSSVVFELTPITFLVVQTYDNSTPVYGKLCSDAI